MSYSYTSKYTMLFDVCALHKYPIFHSCTSKSLQSLHLWIKLTILSHFLFSSLNGPSQCHCCVCPFRPPQDIKNTHYLLLIYTKEEAMMAKKRKRPINQTRMTVLIVSWKIKDRPRTLSFLRRICVGMSDKKGEERGYQYIPSLHVRNIR